MKKQKPVSRKKAPPFRKTLRAVRTLLHTKLQEREACVRILSTLNMEIPNLERTCRALEAQLNGKGVMPNEAGQTSAHAAKVTTGDHRAATSDSFPKLENSDYPIPPEVLAKLPPDYQKPVTGEEDEFLPKIEGKPVLPEK